MQEMDKMDWVDECNVGYGRYGQCRKREMHKKIVLDSSVHIVRVSL